MIYENIFLGKLKYKIIDLTEFKNKVNNKKIFGSIFTEGEFENINYTNYENYLSNVSHAIIDVKIENNEFRGTIEILNNIPGRTLKQLIEYNLVFFKPRYKNNNKIKTFEAILIYNNNKIKRKLKFEKIKKRTNR